MRLNTSRFYIGISIQNIDVVSFHVQNTMSRKLIFEMNGIATVHSTFQILHANVNNAKPILHAASVQWTTDADKELEINRTGSRLKIKIPVYQ